MPTGAHQPSCCWDHQSQGLGTPKPACLAETPAGTAAPGAKHSTGGGQGVVGLCHPSAVVVMGKGGMWGGHGVLNMEVKPASVSRASVASLLRAH